VNKDRTIHMRNVWRIESANLSDSGLTLTLTGTRAQDYQAPEVKVVIHLQMWHIPHLIQQLMSPMKAKVSSVLNLLERCRKATE
jgi:hypothetical protein